MAEFCPVFLFHAHDDHGYPLQGGKLFSYEAMTDTPKDTYRDFFKLATWTNPIVLDARGEAMIYAEGNYKFVLKDMYDNLIWTADNINFVDLTGMSEDIDNIQINIINLYNTITDINDYLNILIENFSAAPKAFPFFGRGDTQTIAILDENGDQAYFKPDTIRVETEGGTKTRWPNRGLLTTSGFDEIMFFDVVLDDNDSGIAITPKHDFTFPYDSPCVAWYHPDIALQLPPLDIPELLP
jgi:hypothetical protein